jgi:AcrR family transcriptional regulator
LFGRQGYGATSLMEIAQEAGVAVQTVYAVYGSKAGILERLRESVVRQPEAARLYEEALQERDRQKKMALFARSIRQRWEQGHDIVTTDMQAGATDPRLRRGIEKTLEMRRAGIERLAQTMARGPEAARMAARIDALTLPEVYRELTEVHGWTPDEYETWLASQLKAQRI